MNGRMTIRVSIDVQRKLKELAYLRRVSLNQICIELFETGLAANGISTNVNVKKITTTETSEQNKNQYQDFIDSILGIFESGTVIAILKTEGYVADYVLIFVDQAAIPANFQLKMRELFQGLTTSQFIFQALNHVTAEQPPNLMWIQIAQKAEMLWASTDEVREGILLQLENWGGYVA